MDVQPALPFTYSGPISTERLTLRLLTEDDTDDVHAYQGRADVCEYLLFEPRTRDEVLEKMRVFGESKTLAVDHDYFQLGMELPTADGSRPRIIGDIYFALASVENSRAEIGWALHPDFAGKGYASEGARAVLTFAFETLQLHRVIAELDPRNERSKALCRRLGMREEAFFVKDLWFRGDWADTGMYAILRDEWLAQQA
jgi:RimJ/RimL family protein N-acetyltransferase